MNVPRMVRRYAQDAHKRYAAQLEQMRERITERPGDLTGDRFADFFAAQVFYNLYAKPLALDAVGNTSYNNEKLMDRITDARDTALRGLLRNSLPMSGIGVVTQQIQENETRRFLANMTVLDMVEDKEEEPTAEKGEWPAMGAVILVQDRPTTDAQRELWGNRQPPTRKGEVVETPADGSTFLTIDVGGGYGGVTYASRDFATRYAWKPVTS
ncbi:hypothetical protein [Streptomyces sp. NPDC088727]|uniref:hypothetical protein n=1 Tax=Streptomyces sp. NPDC088727 TaxID=3365875 RepID=UPI00381F63A9